MSEILYFIQDKANCSGCTACVNVCPTACITMGTDEEGFYYPYYDAEKCINCRKCELTCPILNNKNTGQIDDRQFVITARTKDNNIWHKSSSGGAFSEICQSYGDENTVVVGVEMQDFKAQHSCVIGVKKIDKFRKSKYIQSDLKNIFIDIKHKLDSGKKLIFTGAPCQIAGLRAFLKKDYEKLLLIDFICHGVGSPLVFKSYIEHINATSGKILKNYNFREKKRLKGNYETYYSKYEYTNGKTKYINRDLYIQFFLKQLCIRPSCGENCKYRNNKRLSDITIADYKGPAVKKKHSWVPDYRNYSSIIFNTQKGMDIYKALRENMIIQTSTLEELKNINPLFFYTTKENPNRDYFFKDFKKGKHFGYLEKQYLDIKPQKYKSNYIKIKLKQLYLEIQILYNNIISYLE